MIQIKKLTEFEFFRFHDAVKRDGHTIWKVIEQISGNRERIYTLFYS